MCVCPKGLALLYARGGQACTRRGGSMYCKVRVCIAPKVGEGVACIYVYSEQEIAWRPRREEDGTVIGFTPANIILLAHIIQYDGRGDEVQPQVGEIWEKVTIRPRHAPRYR